jgi:hypothetical protein
MTTFESIFNRFCPTFKHKSRKFMMFICATCIISVTALIFGIMAVWFSKPSYHNQIHPSHQDHIVVNNIEYIPLYIIR